jgi:hypothetical protein
VLESAQERVLTGFLQSVHDNRSRLLSDALTIWRWGRQNPLPAGSPLGNYGPPLVEGAAELGATGIGRLDRGNTRSGQFGAVIPYWPLAAVTQSTAHQDKKLKGTELAEPVLELIDDQSSRKADGILNYNRQRWLPSQTRRHLYRGLYAYAGKRGRTWRQAHFLLSAAASIGAAMRTIQGLPSPACLHDLHVFFGSEAAGSKQLSICFVKIIPIMHSCTTRSNFTAYPHAVGQASKRRLQLGVQGGPLP